MYQLVKNIKQDVIQRYRDNPLITIEDLPSKCSDIWNAGVMSYCNKHLLLLTVETLEGLGCIYLAHSEDGYNFIVEPEPFMNTSNQEPFSRYETFGIYDPRITEIDSTYYIPDPVKAMAGE